MLFNNDKPMVKYILLFLAILLFMVGYSTCSHSAELDVAYGRTLLRGNTDAAAVTVVWPKQIGDIDLFAGLMMIGTYVYNGASYANQPVTRAGIIAHAKGWNSTLGIANIQHEDALNSGTINFNLALGYTFKERLSVSYMHISNAGSHYPNVGRDMLMFGWRFR